MSILIKKALHKYSKEQLIKVIRVCNPFLKGLLKLTSWDSVSKDEARVSIFETDNIFVGGVKKVEARISLGIGREDSVFM